MQKKPTKTTSKKTPAPAVPAKPAVKVKKGDAPAAAAPKSAPVASKAAVAPSMGAAKAGASKMSAAKGAAPKGDTKATVAAPPPPPPKTKFTREELKHFKAQLLELRDRLTRQVGAMEGQAFKEGDSEVSVDHMADHGTDTFDQDFTLGLIENEEATIR